MFALDLYRVPWWKRYIYFAVCTCADFLDIFFSAIHLHRRTTKALTTSDIDHVTNEEIINIIKSSGELLHPAMDHVYITSPQTICKYVEYAPNAVSLPSECFEANAQNLAYAQTTIPVPRIRRVIKRNDYVFYLVQDYIKGQALADVWNQLTIWKKIWVAFTLRKYIRQLHRIKAPSTTPPGPVSSQPQPIDNYRVLGEALGTIGPFDTSAEFSALLDQYYSRAVFVGSPYHNEKCNMSELVLGHQDLTPRNMIIGEDGQLWIIDWGNAGFYPPWFEYAAMTAAAHQEEILFRKKYRYWNLIVPFVCGPYFQQMDWLVRCIPAFRYC
ncbi:hypothetical protein D9756_008740 [Leucocoprinus leucothites]|uniref:Aminoglycoside phosphotransferase domain-containing protein n=1 Tax=Leucocoprinus leucothites TaxID=201217 RepID=A0A8H5CYZ7_9AGAR|nr:hypothetical protein D9756_008740 [Leucoagaricus leucothites]